MAISTNGGRGALSVDSKSKLGPLLLFNMYYLHQEAITKSVTETKFKI